MKQPCRHQDQPRRTGGSVQVPEQRDSALVEQTMIRQVNPLPPVKEHGGAHMYTVAHGGPKAGAGGYILMEAADHGEPTLEQVYWQKLWPMGNPCWSSPFRKGCAQWKEFILEQFLENFSL